MNKPRAKQPLAFLFWELRHEQGFMRKKKKEREKKKEKEEKEK